MNLQEIIRSANNGDAVAMFELFEHYNKNNQNDAAKEWLYKSADNGYLIAMDIALIYTYIDAEIWMKLGVFNEALKVYAKGWNYLSMMMKENGSSQEKNDNLTKNPFYTELSVGIASCLILTKQDKAAYNFIKKHAFLDEQKVLLGIAIMINDDIDEDCELTKTAFDMLKIITYNKNLKLNDRMLAFAYTYLVQGYLKLPISISSCSSQNEALEKAYCFALEASRKGGHTGSVGKDMLNHFRKSFSTDMSI